MVAIMRSPLSLVTLLLSSVLGVIAASNATSGTLTPEAMLSAPRRGAALPNADGTLAGKLQLRDQRLFSNSISYYCDGVRVSRYGYVFCAAGDGVDVIEPLNGATLGRIRVAGTDPNTLAVNIAFQDHTLWIVGHGGVWKVTGIREVLTRKW